MSKSNSLRNSNVRLCPLPKTDLFGFQDMEKLLKLKTVAFLEDKQKKECSFLRSFKQMNDADTSA